MAIQENAKIFADGTVRIVNGEVTSSLPEHYLPKEYTDYIIGFGKRYIGRWMWAVDFAQIKFESNIGDNDDMRIKMLLDSLEIFANTGLNDIAFQKLLEIVLVAKNKDSKDVIEYLREQMKAAKVYNIMSVYDEFINFGIISYKIVNREIDIEITPDTPESKNDYSHITNIYELFEDDYDYPSNEQLTNGVPMDTNFTYVATTYLNGFINYVDIFHAIMIRRYQPLEPNDKHCGWKKACENIINGMEGMHTNLSKVLDIDDMLILGETEDSYWLFWVDCDCSDSCIGRLNKEDYTKEELIEILHRTVPNIANHYEEYIVLPEFGGWITL